MKIGNFTPRNPYFLAPMAGITDWPFRMLCVEQGAGLVYTEMVNVRALHHQDPETLRIAQTHESERPCAVQLFGHEPDMMAEAVRYFLNRPDIGLIDINMGCPTPKIIKNGDGSALMTTPELAQSILSAAVQAAEGRKPVTVKFRKGWSAYDENFIEFGLMAQEAGVSAVTLHGRTREQMYSGTADWEAIRRLKATLNIPVIGNGDVRSLSNADRMMKETGCDAVMIGRGAQGNPWVFSDGLAGVPLRERVQMILRHHEMMVEYKGETTALLEMRKHVAWYLHGLPKAGHIRAMVYSAQDQETVQQILEAYQNELDAWESIRDKPFDASIHE